MIKCEFKRCKYIYNVLSFCFLLIITTGCDESKEIEIDCSKNQINYIQSTSSKYVHKIELTTDDVCFDSLHIVLLSEIPDSLNREEEIYEFARNRYNKILIHKENLTYQEDWYSSKFLLVVLSDAMLCNKKIKLKMKLLD